MKKTTKSPKKSLYNITLLILGKKFQSSGESVSEALLNFKEKNIKPVRSILTVAHNDKIKERILMPAQTARLFNSHGITKEVAIKNASLMFDGI